MRRPPLLDLGLGILLQPDADRFGGVPAILSR